MYALFIEFSEDVPYKKLDYEGEEETFEQKYILFEELPAVYSQRAPGQRVVYNGTSFSLGPLPGPTPPSPEDRITELEDENATLALELVETQIRLEQAESEQAALLLELVNKGVI